MPIRAEMRERYPPEWPLISLWIRLCAGWRCEWCNAEQGEPHPITGSKVVLTVAHLDHTSGPEDVRPANLAALCQRCHLRHDAQLHRANRTGIEDLFISRPTACRTPHHPVSIWESPDSRARGPL